MREVTHFSHMPSSRSSKLLNWWHSSLKKNLNTFLLHPLDYSLQQIPQHLGKVKNSLFGDSSFCRWPVLPVMSVALDFWLFWCFSVDSLSLTICCLKVLLWEFTQTLSPSSGKHSSVWMTPSYYLVCQIFEGFPRKPVEVKRPLGPLNILLNFNA